jgi:catechol 2,3-dioxygenase-like lactoylglutathione lyase family enzyme
MTVKRIVANIATERVEDAREFYAGILGLHVVMDLGWIVTFAGDELAAPQVSIATEAGLPIEYGPVDEPWGVRRFYVRDPFGRLLNILAHQS